MELLNAMQSFTALRKEGNSCPLSMRMSRPSKQKDMNTYTLEKLYEISRKDIKGILR